MSFLKYNFQYYKLGGKKQNKEIKRKEGRKETKMKEGKDLLYYVRILSFKWRPVPLFP
jgi:hypothetical protein